MSEPLPRIKDYEDMGLGLFVHWGCTEPSCGEWTEFIHGRPREEYGASRRDVHGRGL